MSNFHVHTQITIVICVAVVALFWIGFQHSGRIEKEREITNRIALTNGNGVEIKRRY